MRQLKFCHGEGHTEVCYDNSGNYVITGGKNAEICIWEGPDDTDTTSIKVGQEIFALGHQNEHLYSATAGNTIQISTFPDGLNDGIATRFTAPCRHFSFSNDGKTMVAGSDEFKIKVLSLEDNECNYVYTEHKAPILSVALDPTGEFVASSSCDGTVKVWNVIDGATEMSSELLTPCNHSNQAKSLCRMCWSQDGEFLLVPVDKTIQILLRSSWAVTHTIEHPHVNDTINVMALSEDGKHLAVGCVNGVIGIFDWQNRSFVERHVHPQQQTITSLAWNPTNPAQLAFCDKMGQLGFLENLKTVPEDFNSSSAVDGMLDAIEKDDFDPFVMNGDGLDIDDENSIDIGSIKRSYNLEEDDNASVASVKNDQPLPAAAILPQPIPQDFFKPTPLQPSFQPGSTPEHLSSRFMMWNSVGIVRQNVSDDDSENSIDVEFHNAATHHSLHIDNNSDYVMADLSSQALVLASPGDEEVTSKLFCMHFGSWDSDKEWSVNMPEGENIEALTVTDHWLAVATDSRFIRIFTISGMQCQIFSVPGNVVALASYGNKLMIVYHKAMGIPGDQYLGVTVAKVRGRKKSVLLQDDTLPLSPKSKLSWLGFSDEGTPFYMDTEGILRMMSQGNGQLWVPICHTRHEVKGKSDHNWLVGVNERQQQIRCIPCKGSRFPATLPRPAIAILSFQLHLCERDTERSRYEESYQKSLLIAQNLLPTCGEDDLEVVKELKTPLRESLMKLFALASKAEKDFRALEVCEFIEDQDLLEIAATYATRLRRIQLAERVNQVLSSRQDETGFDDDDDEVEEDHIDDSIVSRRSKTQSDDDDEDDEMEEDDKNEDQASQESSGFVLQTSKSRNVFQKESSARKNPFKVATSLDQSLSKGSHIFDKIQKKSSKPSPIIAPLPVTIKKSSKKSGNQGKLTGFNKTEKQNGVQNASSGIKKDSDSPKDSVENQPMQKRVSAFDLWLEQSMDDLREEYPDLSEEDLATKAAGAFQQLPKEERLTWIQKAKSQSSNEDATLKRKLPSDVPSKEDNTGDTNDSKRSKTDKKAPLSQSTNAKLAMFAKSD